MCLCGNRMHTYRDSTFEPIKRTGICCDLKLLNAKNIFRKFIKKQKVKVKKEVIKLVYIYTTNNTNLCPLSGIQKNICKFLK